MKFKILVAMMLVVFCSNSFAVESAKDKSALTKDPVECESYIKSTLSMLESTRYADDVKRINEIAKTSKCAARDELHKLLNFPKLDNKNN